MTRKYTPPLTDEIRDNIIVLSEAGLTTTQIENILNVTKSVINVIISINSLVKENDIAGAKKRAESSRNKSAFIWACKRNNVRISEEFTPQSESETKHTDNTHPENTQEIIDAIMAGQNKQQLRMDDLLKNWTRLQQLYSLSQWISKKTITQTLILLCKN